MYELEVGIVPKLWDVQFRVRIPVGTRDFSLSPKCQTGSGAQCSLLFDGYGSSFPVVGWGWGVKWLMHQVHCFDLVHRSRTSGAIFLLTRYAHTVYRDSCITIHAWLNFFKWILSKHSALANRISILTRLCTGKPSNFGLISDQNIYTGSGANWAAFSIVKAWEWLSATTYCRS
jgi:hypothetical protein